jgi:hypothetical protein
MARRQRKAAKTKKRKIMIRSRKKTDVKKSHTIVRKKTAIGKRKPAKRQQQRLWSPTPKAQKVIDTTQDVFDNTAGASGDCNKFVKAVCDKLVTNPFDDGANADDITKNIRDANWRAANGWTGLDEDPVSAKTAADNGDLVIGGATGADLGEDHGHVVVVVTCESFWKGYGYASWGMLGGTGMVDAKMTLAYKAADLPSVSYMSKPT